VPGLDARHREGLIGGLTEDGSGVAEDGLGERVEVWADGRWGGAGLHRPPLPEGLGLGGGGLGLDAVADLAVAQTPAVLDRLVGGLGLGGGGLGLGVVGVA
jgi:hypothetical protein